VSRESGNFGLESKDGVLFQLQLKQTANSSQKIYNFPSNHTHPEKFLETFTAWGTVMAWGSERLLEVWLGIGFENRTAFAMVAFSLRFSIASASEVVK